MHQQNILIVEDDPNSALLVKDFLTLKGFATDHVKDGLTAVAKIDTADYCLIILDLRLPGQNGFVTAEKLRQSSAGAFIPIIVLTAFADIQTTASLSVRRQFVLSKPVNIKELYYIVDNLPSCSCVLADVYKKFRINSTCENAHLLL